MFAADATIAQAIAGADSTNGPTNVVVCNASALAYAVEAQLVSLVPTAYWCVDSTGTSKQVTTALGTDTACPAS